MKRLQRQAFKRLYVLHASVMVIVIADTRREEGKGKGGELLRSPPMGCCNPWRDQQNENTSIHTHISCVYILYTIFYVFIFSSSHLLIV